MKNVKNQKLVDKTQTLEIFDYNLGYITQKSTYLWS